MEKEGLVCPNPKRPLKALQVKWQQVRTLSLPGFVLPAGLVITLLHQDPNKCQSKVLSKLVFEWVARY